jgi:GTP1/Obg family GTP-binding protein
LRRYIKQQAELFHSIKPLFANKPLVIAINKVGRCSLTLSNPR